MGKNWRGGRNRSHDGSKEKISNDLPSCRGLGIVIGTCDAARERETSKELVNLFNQIIEELNDSNVDKNDDVLVNNETSAQSMLFKELNEIRSNTNSASQNVMSINTGVKGIVCIKFLKTQFNPYDIVVRVFEKVKATKQPCCRHIVRMIPLLHTFYPNMEELEVNLTRLFPDRMNHSEPSSTDTCTSSSSSSSSGVLPALTSEQLTPTTSDSSILPTSSNTMTTTVTPILSSSTTITDNQNTASIQSSYESLYTYTVFFKARNHSTLSRNDVVSAVSQFVPINSKLCLTSKCQDIYFVEALKNICGISKIPSHIYEEYLDFNIRKYQAFITGIKYEATITSKKQKTSHSTTAITTTTVATAVATTESTVVPTSRELDTMEGDEDLIDNNISDHDNEDDNNDLGDKEKEEDDDEDEEDEEDNVESI